MCDDCDYSDDEDGDREIGYALHSAEKGEAVEIQFHPLVLPVSEVAPPDVRPAWRRRLRVPKIGRGTAFALGLVAAELVRVLL
jgi:hypothetical protein